MTTVKLRMKPISGNRQSLYLDFYPPIPNPATGKLTRREFLGLFLVSEIEHKEQTYSDDNGKPQKRIVPVLDKMGNPKRKKITPLSKQHNKETFALAENIRAKRQIEIQNGQYGFISEQKRNADFVHYFHVLAEKRSASNHDNWISAFHYLEKFTGGGLRFSDLNETFCNEFREYLLSTPGNKSNKQPLSQNSALSYFNKFKAALKQAYKDGLLNTDLNAKVQGVKPAETHREFLTLEELQALVKTDCQNQLLKRAAIFSALTGLRFSDIQKLVWGEVQHSEAEGYYLQFRQQKTGGVEVLPVSEQAYNLLGQRGAPTDRVFEGLTYSAYYNKHLYQWIARAGITKDITFHCFRHTFATLQLSLGTDIYTVSKMLGHRELKTTQVYAKIIDQTKREAADRIKIEF